MIYLPTDWLKDPEHESEVRALLEEQQHDIKIKDGAEEVKARLKELGEMKSLKEFEKGVFNG